MFIYHLIVLIFEQKALLFLPELEEQAMNRHALLCRTILEHPEITQRELARQLDLSLGTVNHLIKECISEELVFFNDNHEYSVSQKGMDFLEPFRVDGAVILAAGFGSRFVPLTFEMPKGLLEVFGERMIERQIKQLHAVGIKNITIVVGYLKEKFEYLIDQYGVTLLYNPEYSSKNTLATVFHAAKVLEGKNMYLLSSDNWMRENMFHTYECGSWYAASYQEGRISEWCLSFNKKGLIQEVQVGGHDSWFMYGPVYLTAQWLSRFLPVLKAYYQLPGTEQMYWEHVYMEVLNGSAGKRLLENGIEQINGHSVQHLKPELADLSINRQPEKQIYEFENLEELRQFDSRYQTRSDNHAMELVAKVFDVEEYEIQDIKCLKAGMTNKSFLFRIGKRAYICRVPGPGTELLINRREEQAVYKAVTPLNITEHILYFDGDTGYKIAEFYEGARNSDASSWADMEDCMAVVRKLHQADLKVDHHFDIRERINFYENLCLEHGGVLFEDYEQVRSWMNELLDGLDQLNRPETLSHIDSVADNFLFLPNGDIRLIDWEYAGMCDPLIDVSMCAIYSYYKEDEVDRLIEIYLQRKPSFEERRVVYSYVALGGFLWSLWAVYKSAVGEEFGEYTLIMYRYAKQYYRKILCNL